MRDDDVRASCFASLDVLCAQYGDDVPYRGGLNAGFPYRGNRMPFLSPQKGIFRARHQSGPAALSVNTSSRSPYDDEPIAGGFLYAYRAGDIDQRRSIPWSPPTASDDRPVVGCRTSAAASPTSSTRRSLTRSEHRGGVFQRAAGDRGRRRAQARGQ